MPTASSPTEASRSVARALTLAAAAGLLLFGLLPTLWQHQWAWAARFALFSILGLWLAHTRWDALKMIGVGTVMLLLANQLLSPFLMDWLKDSEFIRLGARIDRQIRIVGDVMPGFQGIQHVTTDGKGFRTTLPVDYEHKPAGTLRVLAIGGSTTEQIYLDDRKTWTHLLQEGLAGSLGRKVEVINTGVSGLRAVHHLATLQQTLSYQPDLVLISMGINDWNKQVLDAMAAERRGLGHWWAAMNYPETALVFMSRQIRFLFRSSESADKTAAEKVEEMDGAYYSRQNDSLERKPLRTFPGQIEVSAEFAATAERLLASCRENRLRCIFLSQANAYDPAIEPALKKRLWMTPPGADFTLSLQQMAAFAAAYNSYIMLDLRGKGAEVCDVAKALKPSTAFFYDDCHYNEAGARAVAQAVLSCVAAGRAQGPAAAR